MQLLRPFQLWSWSSGLFYPFIMRSVVVLLLLSVSACALGQSARPAGGDADEHLRRGIDAQQRGDANTAIEEYRKALAIRPEMADARANLGAALAATGQFDAAIEEYRRALLNAPDKTSVRMNLALAYYKKGDFEHAKPEFAAVHAARPNDLASVMLLGYSEVKLNQGAEAAALLKPMEPGHETNMDFEFVLASALIASGKESEGLPRMEKVAQATRSADAYVIAGSTRLHRREFKEARADLDAALDLDAKIPGLYTLAGQARDALGDTDAAQSAFQDALRADPRDPTANLYLGTIRLKQRDLENARPLLELALQLQPDNPQARLQMARLDAMTGKNTEAVALLEALEKGDPSWLDPHVELAPLYYKLHRPEDGQREREIVEQIQAKQQQAGPPKE
jgi:tetratricopeptide (TPR) repeat protein